MSFFKRYNPGVEWSDEGEVTLPIGSEPPLFEVYPSLCVSCLGEVGIDGYCVQCGQKAKSLRDHYEQSPTSWMAGVCDIGLIHVRNEDALALQGDEKRGVMVVCDGVTTSDNSDVASMAAARAAREVLWTTNPKGTGTPSSRAAVIEATLVRAVEAANQAVVGHTDPDSMSPAASTIAFAVIDAKMIACANLGDSRVYWLPDDGEPICASRDHSLAQDGIDAGAKRAEAEASSFAHTITKWLGRDAVDLDPYTNLIAIETPGWLIVCSDGLWNYVSEAVDFAQLVQTCLAEDSTPAGLATRLVNWANEQGGHDNITAACARIEVPDQLELPAEADPEAETEREIQSDNADSLVETDSFETTTPNE
ncbi:MAG: serine/threonine-protein phosphatase [Propionibacteriaceae bacterium]|nr:serine/threonine-protein phosphatase [Propionibacteriaceae bacterium]